MEIIKVTKLTHIECAEPCDMNGLNSTNYAEVEVDYADSRKRKKNNKQQNKSEYSINLSTTSQVKHCLCVFVVS